MRFSGKVALVSGGTGALGRAVTLALLREGAEVTVTFRSESELSALKVAAGGESGRLDARRIDITDAAAVGQLVEEIVAAKGRLDVMINAAGGFAGGAKMWDSDPATLERMLALNLQPGFLLARAAAKAMLRQGTGAIVNVAAKAGLDPPAGLAAYAASKAAVARFAECLAEEVRDHNVQVNSISPGFAYTHMTDEILHAGEERAGRREIEDAEQVRITGGVAPEKQIQLALFLASERSNHISGRLIHVSDDWKRLEHDNMKPELYTLRRVQKI